ncbi:hypothetical protein [Deinococcus radiotolerans]|uniref:DUF2384 domain-containing protein n=1 Tax=Deinococcus radiotolerans TaxID=1309407 RepID=A0ABQ2FLC6_9DEIO|nr:hypothetical protein [Deinococcus radiotolerans]GGL01029.1 hypothetical protein GCM10010844_19320 [Deinococcus radiotolerans]
MTAPEPHPLDLLREEARHTDPRAVQRALHARPLTPQDTGGWSAGAEETLRGAIGMERKMQMEMRIGLEGHLDGLPLRRTAPLADMTLPELLAEHAEGRRMLLRVLDQLLTVGETHDLRTWTMGEEVPPPVYILALRGRLGRLDALIASQRR